VSQFLKLLKDPDEDIREFADDALWKLRKDEEEVEPLN